MLRSFVGNLSILLFYNTNITLYHRTLLLESKSQFDSFLLFILDNQLSATYFYPPACRYLMRVTEVHIYRNNIASAQRPRRKGIIEYEHQLLCSQRLDWSKFEYAQKTYIEWSKSKDWMRMKRR